MKFRCPYFILTVVLFLMLVCSSLYGAQDDFEGSVVVGMPHSVTNLDPAFFQNFADIQVIRCVGENLVEYTPDGAFMPCLARKWECSSDGQKWTFYIRKNIYFHDKTILDAYAVKFNIERLIYPGENKKGFGYIFLSPLEDLKKIEVIEKYVLRFEFRRPYPNLLKVLSLPKFAIFSSKALKKSRKVLAHPVGTGPFCFVEWRKGHRIILERNDNYWGRLPSIKRIILEPLVNDSYRQNLFKKGLLDIIVGLKLEDKDKFKQNVKFIKNRVSSRAVLFFNCMKEPFDKFEYREAVSNVFSSVVLKQLGVFESVSDYFHKYASDKKFINERAKFKLDKARLSFKGLDEKKDEITIVISRNNDLFIPDVENIVDKISFILKLANIRCKILLLEDNDLEKKIKNGNYHILIDWLPDCPLWKDYIFFTNLNQDLPFIAGYNRCFYRNKEMGDILFNGKYSVYPEEIEYCAERVNELVFQELPMFELYKGERWVGIKENITGLVFDSFGYLVFSKVKQ